MGRYSSGYLLHYQCKRIELSHLIKSGIIKKGSCIQTTLQWTDNSSISIRTKFDDYEAYIQIEYTHKNSEQIKQDFSYKIKLVTLPSNLGRGNVLFMICSISGRLCRKLFMAYGSPYFKSIKAYNARIYYTGQLSSKLNRANDKYWHFYSHIESTNKQRNQSHYKGIKTKRQIKHEQLCKKLEQLDIERWNCLPKSLIKHFPNLL